MSSSQVNSMKRSSSAESLGSVGSKTCVCAPTTHAGSFRCRLHRTASSHNQSPPVVEAELPPHSQAAPSSISTSASRTVEAQ